MRANCSQCCKQVNVSWESYDPNKLYVCSRCNQKHVRINLIKGHLKRNNEKYIKRIKDNNMNGLYQKDPGIFLLLTDEELNKCGLNRSEVEESVKLQNAKAAQSQNTQEINKLKPIVMKMFFTMQRIMCDIDADQWPHKLG